MDTLKNTFSSNKGSDPTGPHDSHLANKADPRVDSTQVGGHGNTAGAGGPTTTGGLTGGSHGTHNTAGGYTGHSDPTGPHDSHLLNKADPRVDSTRVGGHGNTAGAGGPTTAGGLTGGSHGTHNTAGGYTGHSDPTGPHDSHLLNKADPRVDATRVGGYGNTAGAGGPTTTGGLTSGSHGTHNTAGGYTGRSDPTGPHDSHLANKADPRVDSDRVGGYGNTASTGGPTGTYGTHGTTGGLGGRSDPTGPHDAHLSNKADPRVDSTRVGGHGNTAGTGGAAGAGGLSGATGSGHLPGPASNTAGPHSSNLLNKLDPRVDSDLDGSKTTGGNRTFG